MQFGQTDFILHNIYMQSLSKYLNMTQDEFASAKPQTLQDKLAHSIVATCILNPTWVAKHPSVLAHVAQALKALVEQERQPVTVAEHLADMLYQSAISMDSPNLLAAQQIVSRIMDSATSESIQIIIEE